MPQTFGGAIMTNDGIALLTKAQAGECKIAFTKMSIGDGEYSDDEKTAEALEKMTNLKQLRNSYSISSVVISDPTTVKITALLTNEDPYTGETLINEGYYINEIGLFAKEADGNDGTEILYSIAVTTAGQGDFMPAYNGSNPAQITQRYYATVANSADVTIIVTNDEFVLEADFEDAISYIERTMFYAEYEADTETLILTSPSLTSGSEGGDGGSGGTGDYILPTATQSRLGGIKIGNGLTVTSDGTTSVDFSSLAEDAITAAAIVDAGTEEMTQEEIDDAYNDAE